MTQILQGIQYLHSINVVHLDIKVSVIYYNKLPFRTLWSVNVVYIQAMHRSQNFRVYYSEKIAFRKFLNR